jgi:tetratricopeptide (TPR) repeat protein
MSQVPAEAGQIAGEAQVQHLFSEGLALHRENRLDRAMATYEQVLRLMPKHVGALHHVGIIAVQAGNYQMGVGFLRSALAVDASIAAIHLDLGNAFKHLGLLDEALASYDEALRLDVGNPDLYYNRANALQALERFEDALQDYERALASNPRDLEAWNNRGVVLKELSRFEPALESLDQALALHPHYTEALNNRGNVLKEMGRSYAALHCYDKVLELDPNSADAHFNRGTVMQLLGKNNAALESYGRAIELNPKLAKAYNGRANVLQQLKRHDEALADCQQAIALSRDYQEAYKNCANTLRQMKHYETALSSADMAIRLKESDALAHDLRGLILHEMKRYEEALVSYDRAMEHDPKLVTAHLNRANALRDLKRFEQAEQAFTVAIALDPNRPEGYLNRGTIYAGYGQYERALADYNQAIAVKPALAGGYWNRSLLNLEHGHFEQGWIDHEWRWLTPHFENSVDKRDYEQPRWLADAPLENKTILLCSEQGFGDVIQACRFAPMLAAQGARVVLEVQHALVGLLSTLEGVSEVVPRGEPLPAFDYWCLMMSLPLAFKVDLDTIPAFPRYLHSDPAKLAHWEALLGEKTKPRVGIVWSGNPIHKSDSSRSLSFAQFADALSDQFQYVVLQKDIREEDKAALAARPDIVQLSEQFGDFTDSAALCELMDVVVTVDTSVAHLAGALGKPTWILLAAVNDWRWLRERRDSPWYPSVTLYRQRQLDQWDEVLGQVKHDLDGLLPR